MSLGGMQVESVDTGAAMSDATNRTYTTELNHNTTEPEWPLFSLRRTAEERLPIRAPHEGELAW